MDEKKILQAVVAVLVALVGGFVGYSMGGSELVASSQGIYSATGISLVSEFGPSRNPNLQELQVDVTSPTTCHFISKFGNVRGVDLQKLVDPSGRTDLGTNVTANFSGSKIQLFDGYGNYTIRILGDL